MFPSQREFLKHILDECSFINNATREKTEEQVFKDEILIRAIVRSIEIIGEATKRLDQEYKAKYPHVEWKKMAAARDKMIHHYFGIDYAIVWNIITEKLPQLERDVLKILEENRD